MRIESATLSGFRCFGPDPITVPISSEITAVVGANAAGKTTLLHALSKSATRRADRRSNRSCVCSIVVRTAPDLGLSNGTASFDIDDDGLVEIGIAKRPVSRILFQRKRVCTAHAQSIRLVFAPVIDAEHPDANSPISELIAYIQHGKPSRRLIAKAILALVLREDLSALSILYTFPPKYVSFPFYNYPNTVSVILP